MTSPAPRNWTFRPAVISEAEEACAVIRRSIIELCGADHDGNPATLDRWLANKTPDQVRQWIEANPGGVLARTGGNRAQGGDGAHDRPVPWQATQTNPKGCPAPCSATRQPAWSRLSKHPLHDSRNGRAAGS